MIRLGAPLGNVKIQITIHLWSYLVLCALSMVQGWDYTSRSDRGPTHWHKEYSLCAETEQSPIDIVTGQVWHSSSLHAFDMVGYESIPRSAHWEMYNSGHGVEIALEGDYMLKEGGLEGEYKAAFISFHWGADDHIGSEHTLNGISFPMEVQITHYKKEFGSMEEAFKHESGVAILAFHVETVEGNTGSRAFNRIIDSFENVTFKGDRLSLRPVPLFSILPLDMNNYFRYKGSLTRPPCYESVVWSVFRDRIAITPKQLRKIRARLSRNAEGEPFVALVNNFRSTQNLGTRYIYSSDQKFASLFTAPLESPVSFTLAVFLGIVVIFLIIGKGDQ